MSYSLLENKPHRLKKRYVPDLDGLHSQCELNYWLLIQMFPVLVDLNTSQQQPLEKMQWCCQTDSVHMIFDIVDVAPYTTTLTLKIKTPTIHLERSGGLIVRLYHDAQMVEVMEGSGPAALQAIYENAFGGHTVDEKRQANLFIGECLRACFQANHSQAAGPHN